MKLPQLPFLVLVVSIAAAATGYAQSDSMKGMEVKESTAAGKSASAHKATGTVTKVDAASSKVTIAHGPVESLNWPPMTMNFIVKDKALLGKLSSGKKVEFEFVQQGRDYVIVSAK
jgi:Cu(I)/Ag(I) efflux system periplasmic protein CusF